MWTYQKFLEDPVANPPPVGDHPFSNPGSYAAVKCGYASWMTRDWADQFSYRETAQGVEFWQGVASRGLHSAAVREIFRYWIRQYELEHGLRRRDLMDEEAEICAAGRATGLEWVRSGGGYVKC